MRCHLGKERQREQKAEEKNSDELIVSPHIVVQRRKKRRTTFRVAIVVKGTWEGNASKGSVVAAQIWLSGTLDEEKERGVGWIGYRSSNESKEG